MMSRRKFLGGTAVAAAMAAAGLTLRGKHAAAEEAAASFEVTKSEAEWRAQLTPAQYRVLREHGTERAGTSPLDKEKRIGTYHCAGCDLPLFASATKYDSRTGWPSF